MKNRDADRKLSRTGGVVSLIALENGQAASISPVNKKAKKTAIVITGLRRFTHLSLTKGIGLLSAAIIIETTMLTPKKTNRAGSSAPLRDDQPRAYNPTTAIQIPAYQF